MSFFTSKTSLFIAVAIIIAGIVLQITMVVIAFGLIKHYTGGVVCTFSFAINIALRGIGQKDLAEAIKEFCTEEKVRAEQKREGGAGTGYAEGGTYAPCLESVTTSVDCSGISGLSSEQLAWIKEAANKYLGRDQAKLIAAIMVESSEKFNSKDSVMTAAEHLSYCLHLQCNDLREAYAIYNAESGNKKYENADKMMGVYDELIRSEKCKVEESLLAHEMGCNDVPLYKQNDKRWKRVPFGGCGTIGSAGCGITSAAMVLGYYNKNVIPPMLALEEYRACETGCEKCQGTKWEAFGKIAQKYELNYQDLGNNLDLAIEHIKKGRPIIASVGAPETKSYGRSGCTTTFTKSRGHFIVLTCVQGNAIAINDPGRRNVTSVPIEQVKKCGKNYWLIYK